jgi:hypothetical protein
MKFLNFLKPKPAAPTIDSYGQSNSGLEAIQIQLHSNQGTFYKIGVTTRPIIKRIVEVETDLTTYYKTVAVNVLDSWAHRGNIELYFKQSFSNSF